MIRLLLVFFSLFLISGCTINIDDNVTSDEEIEEDIEEDVEKEKISSIGNESSIDNPLSIGEYGLASKYNAVISGYKDVDVSITKIYDNSEDIVSEYNYNNPDKVLEKKDGYKYVVLDYEVIFFDFETESFGTDVILDVEVVNTDGNSFVVDSVKQVISVNVLSNSVGIVDGDKGVVQIAFAIPENVSSYVVKFGTLEHTIAYYKV